MKLRAHTVPLILLGSLFLLVGCSRPGTLPPELKDYVVGRWNLLDDRDSLAKGDIRFNADGTFSADLPSVFTTDQGKYKVLSEKFIELDYPGSDGSTLTHNEWSVEMETNMLPDTGNALVYTLRLTCSELDKKLRFVSAEKPPAMAPTSN